MNVISPPHRAGRKSRGWCHIGGIGDGIVRAIGLRVIVRCLADAAEGDDGEALARFRAADQIRRQLGLCWNQVVASEDASGCSLKEVA